VLAEHGVELHVTAGAVERAEQGGRHPLKIETNGVGARHRYRLTHHSGHPRPGLGLDPGQLLAHGREPHRQRVQVAADHVPGRQQGDEILDPLDARPQQLEPVVKFGQVGQRAVEQVRAPVGHRHQQVVLGREVVVHQARRHP